MLAEGLQQRFLTAVLVALPLLAVLFLTPAVYGVGLLTLMVLAGAWEWAGFFPRTSVPGRVAYLLMIAVTVAYLAMTQFAGDVAWLNGYSWPALEHIFWVAVVWWVIAFFWLLRFPTPIPVWLLVVGGVMVLVPGWAALALLQFEAGPRWLLFFFVVIVGADTGAYFSGRAFGKTRLAPKVSPGKTWEGVIGGLLMVTVVALTGSYLLNTSITFLWPLCVAVALVSIVGDLTISMFKRNAGLKDSGTLFPGHGGVLDRVDSIAAGAPFFVIGLSWGGLIA